MPSAGDRMRNNVRAGIFVVVAVVLALAVIVVLGDVKHYFEKPVDYVVTFPVKAGVKNLSGGSDVRVGGLSMGRVTGVRLVSPEQADTAADTIEVAFTLSSDIRLYSNARIAVTGQLIGSEAWLDITDLGGPDAGTLLQRGETVEGETGSGMLASLLGPNADRVDRIIANVELGTEFFADMDGLYERDVRPVMEDVKVVTGDARHVVSDLRENRWPAWADQVDHAMTRASELADTLNAAADDARALMQNGRGLLADNRNSIDTAIANIERTTDNTRAITDRVRDETIDKVHNVLGAGQDGLDQARGLLEEINQDYELWATDIEQAMANASLASQQLKLTLIEVRRSPWKLLYRPSSDEVEHEMLYEAARSFTLAAADLKSAAASVDRILTKHGDELRADSKRLEEVAQSLMVPLEEYERAQQRLFDVLKLKHEP